MTQPGGPALRTVTPRDADALAALWTATGIGFRREHLDEEIAGVLGRDPDLFMVVEADGRLVAAVMGTFDGFRGWVNRLAVAPDHRGDGLARRLLGELEERLRAKGCHQLNLLVEPHNQSVVRLYERLGYKGHQLIFMTKRL